MEPADRQMLEFSERLTLIPGSLTETDIDDLRSHGFRDRDVLSIILAGAYRNYIVRVADALGTELNPTVDYAPELIRAFGLEEAQARRTLYADRQLQEVGQDARSPAPPRDRTPRSPAGSPDCRIRTLPPRELADDFSRARERITRLSAPHPMSRLARGFALRPDALESTTDYWSLLGFGGSGLGARLESLLGLSVAHTLSSHYLGVHHARRLLEDGMSPETVRGLVDQGLIHEPDRGLLDPREIEAIRFCVRLTQSPWRMARSNLDALRGEGFTDREILTLAVATALQNFLCRVADALGLQPEASLGGATVEEVLAGSGTATAE